MDAPFVRILAGGLIAEQTFKKELAELGVGVEQDRPSGEDDIHSVYILYSGSAE